MTPTCGGLDERILGDDPSAVNSVFTNFDNTVRFYTHDDARTFGIAGNKTMFMTRTKGNRIELFKEFLDAQFTLYREKQDTLSKLFLINAWNEWGEQMVMEPTNEYGFEYLQAFQERLIWFWDGLNWR